MAGKRRSRLKRFAIILAAALITVLLVGAVAVALTTRSFSSSGRIARNVNVAGVPVQNYNFQEAVEALHSQWVPTLPKEIAIKYPGGEAKIAPENLGVDLMVENAAERALRVGRTGNLIAQLVTRARLWHSPVSIEVETRVDTEELHRALVELAEKINRKPRNARVKVSGEKVEVVPGETGRALDVAASAEKLGEALTDPRLASTELAVDTVPPAVTAEDLAYIEVVLGQYSTPFNPNRRDRTHNLKLAAGILNETVVKPGERFSLNEVIGPRLTELGYRAAPIFIEGEVRPSTGGGVCQIASTTYNAALLANLDIRERHHHSRPVNYCPTGRDATVYWGQYDLKFVNNLKHAILILASTVDSRLHVKMLGSREDDYEVEIYRQGLTRITHEHREVEDPELEAGKYEVEKAGRDGWRVTAYRTVKRNGKIVRQQKLHTDYYAPQVGIMRLGTKRAEEPEEELPTAEGAEGEPGTEPVPTEGAPGPPRPSERPEQ